MNPVALAGLIGVAVSVLASTARATDKVSCVIAHEAAQEFRQRNLLVQSREQLLLCSAPRCPRLVVEECESLLADVDRHLAPGKTAESPSAPSDPQGVTPEERAAIPSPAAPAGVPARPPSPPTARGDCCAVAQHTAPDRTSLRLPAPATPPSVGSLPRDAPARKPGLDDRWRVPLLAGTLAVAALASAAYFGWRGLAATEELNRRCSPDCDPSQVAPVRRQLLIADLSLMAGVGLGALTAWTIWNGRARETGAVAASSSRGAFTPGAGWTVVPRLGSVHVEYGGRF